MESLFKLIKILYKDTFNFDYSLELSTRPKKFMGEKKDWDYKEKVLEKALKKSKIKYKINKGDGAFYGPKIDLHIKDSLGRSWQLATIQLDFQMPLNFKLSYESKKNNKPLVFLFHPNECLSFLKKKTEKRGNYFSDQLRHNLKMKNLGEPAINLLDSVFFNNNYPYIRICDMEF